MLKVAPSTLSVAISELSVFALIFINGLGGPGLKLCIKKYNYSTSKLVLIKVL